MLHTTISTKTLNTVGECLEAIEAIETDPQNYKKSDQAAFRDGLMCKPCARAQAKIESITKHMDKLVEALEEEEDQMDMCIEQEDTGADVAYQRVSSEDQNTERQLSDVGIKFSRTFTDKCSGGNTDRPQLEEMKKYVRAGDTIHVHSIDRLARNLDDLRTLVKSWVEQGVSVRFHKEGLTFTTGDNNPMGELMLNMLGAVAQFERSMIKERQREGIEKAKERGVYTGRKKTIDDAAIIELLEQGVSMRKAAAQLEVSLSTVQRAKKKYDEAKGEAGV